VKRYYFFDLPFDLYVVGLVFVVLLIAIVITALRRSRS
jgi:hypothetical protein